MKKPDVYENIEIATAVYLHARLLREKAATYTELKEARELVERSRRIRTRTLREEIRASSEY